MIFSSLLFLLPLFARASTFTSESAKLASSADEMNFHISEEAPQPSKQGHSVEEDSEPTIHEDASISKQVPAPFEQYLHRFMDLLSQGNIQEIKNMIRHIPVESGFDYSSEDAYKSFIKVCLEGSKSEEISAFLNSEIDWISFREAATSAEEFEVEDLEMKFTLFD